MKSYLLLAITLLTTSITIGCEEPAVPQNTTASTPAAEPPKDEATESGPGTPLPEDETPITDIPRKFTSHDPIFGRRSRERGGALGTVVATLPYAKHQTLIDSIDHAIDLDWGLNGDYPKSHEEFTERIIKFNNLQLPEIPDYAEYVYVPTQPKVGLQIRLKPGGPRSKVPAGTSAEEAIRMLGGESPAADSTGAEQPTEQASAEPAEEEPSPNIRVRAGQLGQQRNEDVEEQNRALAPGGLAPVGGLGEGEF